MLFILSVTTQHISGPEIVPCFTISSTYIGLVAPTEVFIVIYAFLFRTCNICTSHAGTPAL